MHLSKDFFLKWVLSKWCIFCFEVSDFSSSRILVCSELPSLIPLFPPRDNMSSQVNDYPRLQQQTSILEKCKKEEKVQKKRSVTKLSGASCFAICHCHERACDLLKHRSGKVVEIILVCFHLLAPIALLVVQQWVRSWVCGGWVADHSFLFINPDCRNLNCLFSLSLSTKI